MSLATLIGPGYSGYAVVAGIPIPLLPSNATENENVIKSSGSYSPDPAQSVGLIPVKNRRAIPLSFSTFISTRTMPLIKGLTYGWRTLALMDHLEEVSFTLIPGGGEGYTGSGYVDELTITCNPESLVNLTINMTCWVWSEIRSTQGVQKFGNILSPASNQYKPLPFWQTVPRFSGISRNAIPLSWTLSFKNNWNYQSFLAGYSQPPNPALITAGDLDVIFGLNWVAARNSRPADSGFLRLDLGVPVIDTIYIDRLIRDPQRQFSGIGASNDMIKWEASYYAQGSLPRSN